MYSFRPFHNADPPALCDIWRSQPPQRGLVQPMTVGLLEQELLGKPYFDRDGLIVALKDDTPVGFVHAGFGPTTEGETVATELGVTCMLMMRPQEEDSSLGSDLLAHSEQYLRSRGGRVLYAGGIRPLDPFYLGLYGGSELPGVLESDTQRQSLYRREGYSEIDRVAVLHCDLHRFRPPVDRHQIQLRRSMDLRLDYGPASANWWEACTLGCLERTQVELATKADGESQAHVSLWNMEPLASSWGVRACGLLDLEVRVDERRRGLASYLLSEVFRQLHVQGITLVEAQVMVHNSAARALYQKLGFTEVDQGVVLRKDAAR